ncbi:MAG: hypothetical protein IPQ18_02950 [Saprospiraceae bacterium]|nr:hypothetical protein [Saprospiraceae bacterium]
MLSENEAEDNNVIELSIFLPNLYIIRIKENRVEIQKLIINQ